MPDASERLIYVENDGSARELTDAEMRYVDIPFSPLDGARPYIKSSYHQRNGWGELRGFLDRKNLPGGIAIGPAPVASPRYFSVSSSPCCTMQCPTPGRGSRSGLE